MKKIAFIIPYFGKFNNYFPIWLQSCRYNPSIDWLIFTDDHTLYDFPANVKIAYTTFDETIALFQSKYDFTIALKSPYLLCEYRMAYGEIYADYIKEYDFWGYCDTDVIWGNLRKHITEEILHLHTKISWRGHLTLLKNDARINQLYKTNVNGQAYYKYVFSDTSGFALATDERLINYIFENCGEPVYKGLPFADLKIRQYNFFLHHFSAENDYKNDAQIFLWDKGSLYRLYVYNQQVFREDFAYIHFLKRPMAIDKNFVLGDKFLIVPNKFINYDGDITDTLITEKSKNKFYFSYYISRITLNYIAEKLRYRKSKKQFERTIQFPINKTYGSTIEIS